LLGTLSVPITNQVKSALLIVTSLASLISMQIQLPQPKKSYSKLNSRSYCSQEWLCFSSRFCTTYICRTIGEIGESGCCLSFCSCLPLAWSEQLDNFSNKVRNISALSRDHKETSAIKTKWWKAS